MKETGKMIYGVDLVLHILMEIKFVKVNLVKVMPLISCSVFHLLVTTKES